MKTIVIDRVQHTIVNNWGGGRQRPTNYYDYTVHVVPEGGEASAENRVHTVTGRDRSDRDGQEEVDAFATKIAAVASEGTVTIRKAWEEGEINFLVQVMVPVRAASQEEAEQMVKAAIGSNVIGKRARYHTREGA